jgi:glycosyltransferase involved in cell wall biosynthesis
MTMEVNEVETGSFRPTEASELREGAAATTSAARAGSAHVGYVLWRFPCLSEAWIAEEMIELERQGVRLTIFAMVRPDEAATHGFLDELEARVIYLPRRPKNAPLRVLRALFRALRQDRHAWLRAARASRDYRQLFGRRRLLLATVLHDELRRAGIDHVHVHFANKAARLASLVRRMGGPSYSVTTHANDIWHRKVRAEDLRAILGGAAFVATVTEENRRHLAETLRRPGDVHVVSSSADLSRLGQPRRKQPKSGPVLAVTRFVPKKGLNDLIEACAILAQRSLPVRLELVGDGPLRRELEALAAQVGADVAFGGALPRKEVLECYRRAAVFCLPCVVAPDGDRDGLPSAVLEAMALGVPVVTTDVNGLPEAVIDGETGLTVPQHAPAQVADALARVLSDQVLATRLAGAARRHVEEHFSRERNAARLRSLFPVNA